MRSIRHMETISSSCPTSSRSIQARIGAASLSAQLRLEQAHPEFRSDRFFLSGYQVSPQGNHL